MKRMACNNCRWKAANESKDRRLRRRRRRRIQLNFIAKSECVYWAVRSEYVKIKQSHYRLRQALGVPGV